MHLRSGDLHLQLRLFKVKQRDATGPNAGVSADDWEAGMFRDILVSAWRRCASVVCIIQDSIVRDS